MSPADDGLFRRMLDQRRVMLTGAIEGPIAERVCAQLLVLEADDPDQGVALLAQPELLLGRLERGERLVQRRKVRVADQLGLDRVRGALDGQHAGGEGKVGEVGPTPGSIGGDRRRRGR